MAAVSFLFFSLLLPTIAFGMLNEKNTDMKINVATGLMSQLIGGVGFALLSGQHLTPLLTTAPLSIVTLVLYKISNNFNFDFFSFYAWVGLFNAIYMTICAVTGLSRVMKYSRRSIEEMFLFFIAIAFILAAIDSLMSVSERASQTNSSEETLLFLMLLLGTVFLGLWLTEFTNTPFLNPLCRMMFAGFALPLSVLVMSGSRYIFFDAVKMHNFNVPAWQNITLNVADLRSLPIQGIFGAAAVALPITMLLFIGHNITSATVNSPSNRLKKGPSYHWDIIVLGLLNMVLSFVGLPWLHGAPLHGGLHVKALAIIEEHVDQCNNITQRVVKVFETRISSIVANLMIGSCIFLMPYPLLYIPCPVLSGIFLFIALRNIQANQLFQRLLLLITEQTAYPPNHYLKRVPQKVVHYFTLIQTTQLIVLCAIGFAPNVYVKILFPLVLIFHLIFRHLALPRIIATKYLNALDKFV